MVKGAMSSPRSGKKLKKKSNKKKIMKKNRESTPSGMQKRIGALVQT
jgi:hypothetical protein